MSEIYNELKCNVDKINSLYTNGVTFHKDKIWVTPLNGKVSLEAQGNSFPSRDLEVGFNSQAYGTSGMGVSTPPDIFGNLCEHFASQVCVLQKKETTVEKNTAYDLSFDYQNQKIIKFKDIYLSYMESGRYRINISPKPNQFGFYQPGVYRVESQDKTNPSLLGDCDVEIVSYKTEPSGYVYKTTGTYKINNILRQPSQVSPIHQYFKIKYHQNILSIFEDNFV